MTSNGQATNEPDTAGSDGHPTNGLNDTVHQRHRLGILTIAAEAERVEVAYLRQALELTAGNLSRHLAVLEEASLIQIERGYHGRRAKTWIRITTQGQIALAAEITALHQLIHRHQSPEPTSTGGPAPTHAAIRNPKP